jgi:hypothetical protein
MIRFFNGFLVLFWPDRIFRDRREQQRLRPVIEDLLLAMMFVMVSGVVIFKVGKVPSLILSAPFLLVFVAGGWLAAFLVTSLWAGVLNAGYVLAFKSGGTTFPARFREHWLCRAYVTPWWLFFFFLIAIRPVFGPAWLDVCILSICLLRLMDLEARLHAQVYELSLRLAYYLVLIELALLSVGIILGAPFSRFPAMTITYPGADPVQMKRRGPVIPVPESSPADENVETSRRP